MKTFAFASKRFSPVMMPSRTTVASPADTHCHAARASVHQILRGPRLQAKLSVGAPDDVYEQEADRVAEAVMRMPQPEIQRAPT